MAASWKMQNILSFLSTFLCQNVANHRQDPLLPSLAVIKQALPSKPLCGKTPTKYRKETIADLIPCRHHLSDHCQGKLVTVTKQHSRWALQPLLTLAAPALMGQMYLVAACRPVHTTSSSASPLAIQMDCLSFLWACLANQAREQSQAFHAPVEIFPDLDSGGMFSSPSAPCMDSALRVLLQQHFPPPQQLCQSFLCMGKV